MKNIVCIIGLLAISFSSDCLSVQEVVCDMHDEFDDLDIYQMVPAKNQALTQEPYRIKVWMRRWGLKLLMTYCASWNWVKYKAQQVSHVAYQFLHRN